MELTYQTVELSNEGPGFKPQTSLNLVQWANWHDGPNISRLSQVNLASWTSAQFLVNVEHCSSFLSFFIGLWMMWPIISMVWMTILQDPLEEYKADIHFQIIRKSYVRSTCRMYIYILINENDVLLYSTTLENYRIPKKLMIWDNIIHVYTKYYISLWWTLGK